MLDAIEGACEEVALGHEASQRANLMALSHVLRHNYALLGMAALFTVGAIAVIVTVGYMAQRTIAHYYRYMVPLKDGGGPGTRLPAAPAAGGGGAHMDDETYGRRDDRSKYERRQDRDEYSAIRTRLAQLKAMYKGYNREMSSYARNVLDRWPDDLIDERILAREADDYDYGSGR